MGNTTVNTVDTTSLMFSSCGACVGSNTVHTLSEEFFGAYLSRRTKFSQRGLIVTQSCLTTATLMFFLRCLCG